MTGHTRFAARLLAFQLSAHVAASGVVAALAPTLLLLDAGLRDELVPVGMVLFVLLGTAVAISALALTRPLAGLFRAQDEGTEPESEAVRALQRVPSRLTAAYFLCVSALASILAVTRSAKADLSTHVALAALVVTIVSGVSLASYTMLRSQVAEVMAEISPKVSEEAFVELRDDARSTSLVAARVALSVATPAALVAVGAVLLVYAHSRAAAADARVKCALALARATLEPVEGERLGFEAVRQAAEQHGYALALSDEPQEGVRAVSDQRGEITVRAPLVVANASAQSVVVRFDAGEPGAGLSLVFAVAGLGIGFALMLGSRLGSALSHDVEVARLQVEAMGARDVLRGLRMRKKATFRPVRAMTDAIERLGTIFREFAFAQEDAIVAKRRVEQTRGLFLASMSHDLKAPLNAVLGFAELVKRQPLTDGQRESLAIIEQRGRELLHLVRTILDASRADAGALDLTIEEARVEDLVSAAVADARELEGSRIVAELQPDLPRVTADGARVAQALTLVLLSAARLGSKGVRLRALSLTEGRVRVDVESQGLASALTPEEREALFRAFEHAESARNMGSLGLGLSLARAILRAHGGELEAQSSGEFATLFRLELPVVACPPRESIPSARWVR